MVFFNYATMQMAAKIVYYGPGLCGKTTNLHFVYNKTSPQSRGEMVSLETETDRTLFFDLLPIDVGVIGGFKTRLQLYTVPGQVFYNTTRKLVLKGADGIVFVADSQAAMLDANVDSFRNLKENLAEIGLDFNDIPLVLQLNKRDLPNVLRKDILLQALDPEGVYESVEASAVKGQGVFETLKLVSKLTLRKLRKRMMGEDEAQVASQSTFHVQEAPHHAHPAEPAIDPRRTVAAVPNPLAGAAEASSEAATPAPDPASLGAPWDSDRESEDAEVAKMAADIVEQTPIPPFPAVGPSSRARKPTSEAEPDLKRVKVRSSIDIMAELEALRKKATEGTKGRAEGAPAKREIQKAASLRALADTDGRIRRVRVVLQFEDAAGGRVQTTEHVVDVDDLSDAAKLNLTLKVDFEPDDSR